MKRFSESEKQQCSRIVLYTQRILFWKDTVNSCTAFRRLQPPGAGLSPGEGESGCVWGGWCTRWFGAWTLIYLGRSQEWGVDRDSCLKCQIPAFKKYQLDPQYICERSSHFTHFYCFLSLGFTSRKLIKHPCLVFSRHLLFSAEIPISDHPQSSELLEGPGPCPVPSGWTGRSIIGWWHQLWGEVE